MADDFPVSLVLSGGSLTLSGTNAYSGGTTVSGSGMLVATNDEAFEDGSNLYVGNYSFPFGTVVTAGESASQTAVQGAAAAVPEPGTLTLCARALLALLYRQRKRGVAIASRPCIRRYQTALRAGCRQEVVY